jgi:hypothetical protein
MRRLSADGRDRRAALLACVLAGPMWRTAGAQPATAVMRGAGGGMATRSVSRYLGLERRLQDALAGHDRAGVLALLADEFELRTAAGPETTGADDWLRHEFASPQPEGLVRDLSVREADDLAIVSFLLDRGRAGRAASSTWFVVDVWRQSTQRLLSRSMARASGAPRRPGRPNGRE